jgi:hypothetical protein
MTKLAGQGSGISPRGIAPVCGQSVAGGSTNGQRASDRRPSPFLFDMSRTAHVFGWLCMPWAMLGMLKARRTTVALRVETHEINALCDILNAANDLADETRA